jgi:hypothetical protein
VWGLETRPNLDEICQQVVSESLRSACVGEGKFVQATACFCSPSMKMTPSMTLARSSEPLSRRQPF